MPAAHPPARRAFVLGVVVVSIVLAPRPAAFQGGAPVAPRFGALAWRNIGPNRGGRSLAAAGHSARPFEYYFGAVGGGLWKTTDGGATWAPVTDGQIRSSSVGAVAVSESDPDIVYLGMGEVQLRGNVMQGDGVYKSTDAGKTWTHVGLADTQAIGRIRIHPANPDIVYVAALGHPTVQTTSAECFGRATAARPGRRSSSGAPRRGGRPVPRRERPAACSTPRRGRCTARPGCSRAAARARACSSPPTAATPGPS